MSDERRKKIAVQVRNRAETSDEYDVSHAAADWIIKLQDALRSIRMVDGGVQYDFSPADPDYGLGGEDE